MVSRPVINLVGATATGKSDLAIGLAQRLDGEIINADAMQFYRGMDIGTAKLPPEDRGGIPHHLIDILDVVDDASVAEFQSAARRLIREIDARGHVPILVGGSGLYVRAATDALSFPGTDPVVRARLEVEAEELGSPRLHERLRGMDPAAGAKISPGDTRRIVRALEVIELMGKPFSAHLPRYEYVVPTVQIGLRLGRAELHERIAARVQRMWQAGWTAEVERLLEQGLAAGRTARQAIGYSQIIELLAGRMDQATAVESTITRTRQFAKRQDTWFRRDHRIQWLDAPGGESSDHGELISRAQRMYRSATGL
ncbi:tRNA (adenosine(37)-N6)-dimethylallyltransferase MiaA [Brevibacterium daeguense]|uniref:tRNA dimethylallyltransferase n=1 Tax=Brevibacterium daeguense TaxID=909936 RepID=A0ABP8EM06_9MICO|nr:tRNA (adenosine(37)-N6)-dimethylallyltransferase MiaA [Brevibacterium daeguense]